MRTWLASVGVLVGLVGGVAAGCGSNGSTFDGTSSSGGDGASGGNGNGFGDSDGGGGGGGGGGDAGPACRTSEQAVELRPVYLGFAFDVSGSMGQLDCPQWFHDPNVKWKPVVAATTAFFEDATSVNVNASLVMFPVADGDKCAAAYDKPEVSMTKLPSTKFATELHAYGTAAGVGVPGAYDLPLPGDEYQGVNGRGYSWRGTTPTAAALAGAAKYVKSVRGSDKDGVYALVLVTDGTPSCGNATTTAAKILNDDHMPTYVIGVKNPAASEAPATPPWNKGWTCGESDIPNSPMVPDPNALANLDAIAAAGGTGTAKLVETGKTSGTKDVIVAELRRIRTKSISCEVPRPEPPAGETFDPDKVNVRYDSQNQSTPLGYSADCSADDAWRYKTPANDVIELCESTCQKVKADPFAAIKVEFGCVRRASVK